MAAKNVSSQSEAILVFDEPRSDQRGDQGPRQRPEDKQHAEGAARETTSAKLGSALTPRDDDRRVGFVRAGRWLKVNHGHAPELASRRRPTHSSSGRVLWLHRPRADTRP